MRTASAALLAFALLIASLAASTSQSGARDRHIVIVTPPGDVRLAATREAIDFWNETLSGLHLDPRLVEDRVLVAPPSTRKLERYTRQIWNLAGRTPSSAMIPPAPPEVLAALNKAMQEVLAEPDVKKRLLDLGIDSKSSTPAEMDAQMRGDITKWTEVIDRAGIEKR